MLFNSVNFLLIYLPIILTLYYLILYFKRGSHVTFLSVASLLFYAQWNINLLPILLLSIIFNWTVAWLYTGEELRDRRLLIAGLVVNIAGLLYFKYFEFIVKNLGLIFEVDLKSAGIIAPELPIGISFFTFTQMAYLVDGYYRPKQASPLGEYSLFVNFFPHLLAGPMLYHKDIIPQFNAVSLRKIFNETFLLGSLLFSIGLIKKMLLADPLGFYADQLFNVEELANSSPKLFEAWFGAVAYTFQIYFDFSGYSDMAIGLGLMFGIMLPFNFNSPYLATSIIEYWQRWHMSLTRYILQYVYNPIAIWAHRKRAQRGWKNDVLISIFFPNLLVFLIVGVWHGANWTFVVWGLMHGGLIVINHLWRILSLKGGGSRRLPNSLFCLPKFFWWLLTFSAVIFTFVMFRADSVSHAVAVYKGMLGLNGLVFPNQYAINEAGAAAHWLGIRHGTSVSFLGLLLLSFAVILLPINSREVAINKGIFITNQLADRMVITVIGMLTALSLFSLNRTTTFLYFNF